MSYLILATTVNETVLGFTGRLKGRGTDRMDLNADQTLFTLFSGRKSKMTMPHLENCLHHPDGWCLDCVKDQHEEMEKYQALWVRCLPAVRASADYSCGRISFNEFVSIIEDYHSVNQEDSCDHE